MMRDRLDRALLAELEDLMDGSLGGLVEAYLADAERRLLALADALEAGDLRAMRGHAHSLKGASSNVGAATLAELCGRLEVLTLEGPLVAVAAALDRVRTELREVRDELAVLAATGERQRLRGSG